eukprot:jgi/Ulvmu1/12789/UM097_0016.1
MSNPHNSNHKPGLSVDINSPPYMAHTVDAKKQEALTSPDVSRVGAGLADRAASANEHLKNRLKTEQYDFGGHMLKVDGINPGGSVILSVRLSDQGSSAPWTDGEEGKPPPERALKRSNTHKSLARHQVQIPSASSIPEVALASPSPQSAAGKPAGADMPLSDMPLYTASLLCH